MQSAPQNIPNLAAGFKNNIAGLSVPQNTISNINPPNFQMAPAVTAPVQVAGAVETVSIFGQVIQKKYFYLLLLLAALVVGYLFWRWYNKKKKKDDDDSDDEDLNDDEDREEKMRPQLEYPMSPFLGQMGMPPMNPAMLNQMMKMKAMNNPMVGAMQNPKFSQQAGTQPQNKNSNPNNEQEDNQEQMIQDM